MLFIVEGFRWGGAQHASSGQW